MKLDDLTHTTEPFFHMLAVADPPHDLLHAFARTNSTAVARVIRGSKSGTKAALMDEIGAALQLPTFGENWDALHDILCGHSGPLVLAFADAGFVLASCSPEERKQLATVLTSAASECAKAKPPRPLHIILHCSPDAAPAVEKRWKAAGAKIGH
jgi:hypothetical protein